MSVRESSREKVTSRVPLTDTTSQATKGLGDGRCLLCQPQEGYGLSCISIFTTEVKEKTKQNKKTDKASRENKEDSSKYN